MLDTLILRSRLVGLRSQRFVVLPFTKEGLSEANTKLETGGSLAVARTSGSEINHSVKVVEGRLYCLLLT